MNYWMRNVIRDLIIVTLALVLSLPAQAALTGEPLTDSLHLEISGSIDGKDVVTLTSLSNSMERMYGNRRWTIYARIHSIGGSVEAAMAMGRILRKVETTAHVPPDAACLSACVYLLAAATQRVVEGKVGIHRPYDPMANEIAPAAQREKYKKLEKEIKAYLSEMNIPPRLYDDSMFISPERMKFLTDAELTDYGLNQSDPYAEEARAAAAAKMLGISRAEFAERQILADQFCKPGIGATGGNFKLEWECRFAILKSGRPRGK